MALKLKKKGGGAIGSVRKFQVVYKLPDNKRKCHAHATKVHKVLRVFPKYPFEAFHRDLLDMRSESHLCKAATEISIKASGF